ncbi:GMC family oxidoreductase N-terminal domain-containing protein, partial [Arthrospira platensis SPKY1]|nr:GMC family oxidoreductase N-terminal domain-containing protein [Arthrospira platensis SPKY1]
METRTIRRNVRGCWDLGYCGMGCPTNAKQSMLLTTLPAALSQGAVLYSHLRAERLVFNGGRVDRLEAQALAPDGLHAGSARINLRARHFILAGGAINTPALRNSRAGVLI